MCVNINKNKTFSREYQNQFEQLPHFRSGGKNYIPLKLSSLKKEASLAGLKWMKLLRIKLIPKAGI